MKTLLFLALFTLLFGTLGFIVLAAWIAANLWLVGLILAVVVVLALLKNANLRFETAVKGRDYE